MQVFLFFSFFERSIEGVLLSADSCVPFPHTISSNALAPLLPRWNNGPHPPFLKKKKGKFSFFPPIKMLNKTSFCFEKMHHLPSLALPPFDSLSDEMKSFPRTDSLFFFSTMAPRAYSTFSFHSRAHRKAFLLQERTFFPLISKTLFSSSTFPPFLAQDSPRARFLFLELPPYLPFLPSSTY